MIVGIDEVGRGAWAGPLVVGAVLLGGSPIAGLTDSKKLTKRQREQFDLEIRQKAKAVGLGWVSAKQIDAIGLSKALQLAAIRALAHVRSEYHEIILDGTVDYIQNDKVTVMAKADLLIPSVSAASIVAKVARDRYMAQLDTVFPGYGFTSHVGYGTAVHKAVLGEKGATPVHRMSFEPLSGYQSREAFAAAPDEKARLASTTKGIGDTAETVAAEYLRRIGHTIVERNWRMKVCEIDIVSRRNGVLYFTEVKYRKNDRQGGGMAAITSKKLKQMTFAAETYVHVHRLKDTNPRLAVADVTGQPPEVTTFLEIS